MIGSFVIINSPECQNQTETTEIYKFECSTFSWNARMCYDSEEEFCVGGINRTQSICSPFPYEKEVIIKK